MYMNGGGGGIGGGGGGSGGGGGNGGSGGGAYTHAHTRTRRAGDQVLTRWAPDWYQAAAKSKHACNQVRAK